MPALVLLTTSLYLEVGMPDTVSNSYFLSGMESYQLQESDTGKKYEVRGIRLGTN